MLERKWKTLSGQDVSNIIFDLNELLSSGGKEIHIGSDSQQSGKTTSFVTVLVVITPSKGGKVFYTQEKVLRIKELRERLYKEVWMSTELAMDLTATPEIGELRSLAFENEITIHIDANTIAGNGKFKSNKWAQELAAMAASQGFKTLLKPDSWAASHAADHVVKSKMLGRR